MMKEAVKDLGIDVEVEDIDQPDIRREHGVAVTPTVRVNGDIKLEGKMCDVDCCKEILAEYGKRVLVVEMDSKWNHLDIIFSPVADKLAVICEDAAPDYFIGVLDAMGWELIKVPGEYAFKTEINLLALGDDKVLSFRGNRLNKILKAHGLEVLDPEFGLFTVNGGGPHCNSFELERQP